MQAHGSGKEGEEVKWVRMRMMCGCADFHLVTGGGETGKLLSGCVHLAYRTASQDGRQEEIMPPTTFREQESRGGLSADSPAPFISCFPLVIVCPIETAPRDTHCPVLQAGCPSDGFSGSQTPCCAPGCLLHIWKWQELWACDWWACCGSRTKWA